MLDEQDRPLKAAWGGEGMQPFSPWIIKIGHGGGAPSSVMPLGQAPIVGLWARVPNRTSETSTECRPLPFWECLSDANGWRLFAGTRPPAVHSASGLHGGAGVLAPAYMIQKRALLGQPAIQAPVH